MLAEPLAARPERVGDVDDERLPVEQRQRAAR